MLNFDINNNKLPVFKIIGVGGCGCNAVNKMIEHGVKEEVFVAADTHNQQVYETNTENKIFLGEKQLQKNLSKI